MQRTKVAFCFEDKEYQRRFIKCFMHHYEQIYEVHILGSVEELCEQKEEFSVIVVEGTSEKWCELKGENILCLIDNLSSFTPENLPEGLLLEEKYQEVYKIEQPIRKRRRAEEMKSDIKQSGRSTIRKVGVFSLDCESAQLPVCGMLGEEYGQMGEVLLIDLQMFSGLCSTKESELGDWLTIEDILAAATTGVYTRKNLLAAIGTKHKWDYIYPPRNVQCLAEAKQEIYDAMMGLLLKEFEYSTMVINFGVVFDGVYEWMDHCDCLYLLVPRKEQFSRREQAFFQELKRLGRRELCEQIIRIEMPYGMERREDWEKMSEEFRWGVIGDQVRKYIQVGS